MAMGSGEDPQALGRVKKTILTVATTMAAPGVINWLVASARDAGAILN